MTDPKKSTFTPSDIATKCNTTAKNVRRILRANNERVGRGNRHTFSKAEFDKRVKTVTARMTKSKPDA